MDHEQSWAEGLATEHTHQRELLAAFRGELGAFARECAAALTALDSYVAGLAGVVEVMDAARIGYKHADLVLDIARRLSPDHADAELYERLGDDGDLQPRLVDRAREVLHASPRRTDRELLKAVADAAGVRSRIEQIVGPVPLAALSALRPLARRLPSLATIDPNENETARTDLAQVLEHTAQLATVEGAGAVADQVRELACRAFDALSCEGLARVDFFVTGDRVTINEVNTMPGFTPVSMFPLMWKATGIDYPALVDRLIQTALRRPTGLH
jgi:hypothetical protein